MVNAYNINKDPNKLAVGITLRESQFWGMGLGSQAFLLWLAYQFNQPGRRQIYCQTWSGNTRMIKLAEKYSFTFHSREQYYWEANGQFYDGLTFILTRDAFQALHPDIITTP
jgi:RimJ/RimL family protein N-acetyltransferase